MSQYAISELKKRYQEGKIIPFIGAGLSIPFNLKSWADLVEELKTTLIDKKFFPSIDFELSNKNYQEAIDGIKKYGGISDQPIQEKISTDYSIRKEDIDVLIDNNYSDLVKEKFKIYLTTNYDRLLGHYLPGVNEFNSLTDYTSNMQRIFADNKEKYLFHIHGCVSNPDSIVISSDKYEEIYANEFFDNLMKAFSSNYSFLFLGFSFDDFFVRKLIKEHKDFFKGNHYMVIDSDSVDNEKIASLNKDYGINCIVYSTKNSSHIEEIRKILLEITEEPKVDNSINNANVGIDELLTTETDYRNSLFYRKLQVANIADDLIEVSEYFYIAAEKFIRKTKKLGYPKGFIDGILAEVFMMYKDKYSQIYTRNKKSSEDLLIEIHKNLENLNIERLVDSTNRPMDSENKGFIHVLADDGEKNIWWGDERL